MKNMGGSFSDALSSVGMSLAIGICISTNCCFDKKFVHLCHRDSFVSFPLSLMFRRCEHHKIDCKYLMMYMMGCCYYNSIVTIDYALLSRYPLAISGPER